MSNKVATAANGSTPSYQGLPLTQIYFHLKSRVYIVPHRSTLSHQRPALDTTFFTVQYFLTKVCP